MSERWPAEKRIAFELFGPQAICAVTPNHAIAVTVRAADGSVLRAIGQNQASWAVKIITAKSFRDNITSLYSHNPWVAMGVRVRLWFPELADATLLRDYVNTLLLKAAEQAGYPQLLDGFIDAGPNFKPDSFGRHITLVARRLGVVTWDDVALSNFLDRALRVAKIKEIQIVDRRGQRMMSRATAFIGLCEKLVRDERKKQFGKQNDGTERLQ